MAMLGKVRGGGVSASRSLVRSTVSTLENPSPQLLAALTGNYDYGQSGIPWVSDRRAMMFGPFFAGVRRLSESIAIMPCETFRSEGKNKKILVDPNDDPRAGLLIYEANDEGFTGFELWEGVVSCMLLWGNAYIYKVIDPKSGYVTQLFLLNPRHTRPQRVNDGGVAAGELYYTTQIASQGGQIVHLGRDEVIHIKAFAAGGDLGISALAAARSSLGLAVATEEYAGKFYTQGMSATGVVSVSPKLSSDEFYEMVERLAVNHQSIQNAHVPLVLDNGATYTQVGLPVADAQMLEARDASIRDVAVALGIPGHLIGLLRPGEVSYASLSVQSLEYLVFSLMPLQRRIQDKIRQGMFYLPSDKKNNLHCDFNEGYLLRADPSALADYYNKGIMGGWLNRAEVRQEQGLSWEEALAEFTLPANVVPLSLQRDLMALKLAGKLQLPEDPTADPALLPGPTPGETGPPRLGDPSSGL